MPTSSSPTPNSAEILVHLRETLALEARMIDAAAARATAGAAVDAVLALNAALDRRAKIVVTGVGKSGKVGQKIAATLSSTGSPAIFLHPTEALHGDLGFVAPGDAVLAISYTGNTEELLRMLPALRALKTPIVALTGNPRSKLAEAAEAVIDGSVEQEACPHNLAPTSSTTLALAWGDALAVALMKLRKFDRESFARNHPGGSLGLQLTLAVSDIMHTGDAVATASESTPVDQIVILSTQKRLGAVLIVEGKKLKGIVTDGDIRRALNHREKFFAMTARDVMTKNPTSATPEMLAREALALMENRPSQISVLPVVDARGDCQGLVRLHDLIRTF